VVKNRVPLFELIVDSGVLPALRPPIEIRCSELPELAAAQSCNEADARVTRSGLGMHLHEGRSVFAVEQGFKNLAGIEHHSYAPIYHDALDCRACLH
jgi:hypothetical protein